MRWIVLVAALALSGCAGTLQAKLQPLSATASTTSPISSEINSIFSDIEATKQQFVLQELTNAHNLLFQAGQIIGASGLVTTAPTTGTMVPTPSPMPPVPTSPPTGSSPPAQLP